MALVGIGLAVGYLASFAERVNGMNGSFVVVAALGSHAGPVRLPVAYATRHVRLEPDPREG